MYTQKIHYVHKKYTKCTQNVHKKTYNIVNTTQ